MTQKVVTCEDFLLYQFIKYLNGVLFSGITITFKNIPNNSSFFRLFLILDILVFECLC